VRIGVSLWMSTGIIFLTGHMKSRKPAVLLMYTSSFKEFLENVLQNLMDISLSGCEVRIMAASRDKDELLELVKKYNLPIYVDTERALDKISGSRVGSYDFGTPCYNQLMHQKVLFIQRNLHIYRHVIYSDLDVAWLRNPVPHLNEIHKEHSFAFQSEAQSVCRKILCFGFLSIRSSIVSRYYFGILARSLKSSASLALYESDQEILNRLYQSSRYFHRAVYVLSESLFPNGLGYKLLAKDDEGAQLTQGLQPYIFHANFVVGLPKKRYLLQKYGNWKF
jgi:hypothetical protein